VSSGIIKRKEEPMSIGLSYIDATFLDLTNTRGSFLCKRFSAPFILLERVGDTVSLKGIANGALWQQGLVDEAIEIGSGYERTVSLDVLSARFDNLYVEGLSKPKIYCLKQPTVHAVQMTCNFGVNVLCDETEEFEYQQGVRGDYVVESMMGYNKLVKESDFERIYQTTDLDRYHCRATNIVTAIKAQAASKGSGFESTLTA
jgi:hypothetical protein